MKTPAKHTTATASLKDFAERYRLKVSIDRADGTPIVSGKDGHLYEHVEHLALMFMSAGGTPKKWGNARRACEAAGMEVLQDGDTEGSLTFAPSNRAQSKLAIKTVRCKPIRQMSDAQRANLERLKLAGSLHRFAAGTGENGHLAA